MSAVRGRTTVLSSAIFPAFPHRSVPRFGALWRRASLAILLFLVLIAVLAALYDTFHQLQKSDRASKISDMVITVGTYFLIALIGVSIIFSRRLLFRRTLAMIPKAYMPTEADDVPKAAHELISSEYDRVSVIAHISQPKGRSQAGWGRPGTPNENIHFRSAILSTMSALRSFLPAPASPPSRSDSLSPLAPLLALDPSPIPPALNPLAELYEHYLVEAQYGSREPTEEAWQSVVKIVAIFVGLLGPTARPSTVIGAQSES